MKIGWDLDGVAFDFVDELRRVAIEMGCDPSTLGPATVWDFFRIQWGWDLETYKNVWEVGVNELGLFKTGAPMKGFVEALERMSRLGHTNHIVTARGVGSLPARSMVVANTMTWLDNVAPGLVDSVTFTADKSLAAWLDYFIDDNTGHYREVNAAGGNCYLLSAPYNVMDLVDPKRRIESIDYYVLEIEKETPE
jgi:hypothetical protein